MRRALRFRSRARLGAAPRGVALARRAPTARPPAAPRAATQFNEASRKSTEWTDAGLACNVDARRQNVQLARMFEARKKRLLKVRAFARHRQRWPTAGGRNGGQTRAGKGVRVCSTGGSARARVGELGRDVL